MSPLTLLASTARGVSVATWARDGRLERCSAGTGATPLEDARAALADARAAHAPRKLVLVLDEASSLALRVPTALLARSPLEVSHAIEPDVENTLARRIGHRPVGALLVAAGATDAARVNALLAEQAQRARVRQDVPLLGALLRDSGDVEDAEIERALVRQAWFAAAEGVALAYVAGRPVTGAARSDLMALGLSTSRRAQWLQLAKEHGFQVAGIMAHDSAPLAALEEEDCGAPGVLLHVGSAWAHLMRWDAEQRSEASTLLSAGAAFDADELLELARTRPGERVYLAAESVADRELVAKVATQLEGARTLATAPEDPSAALLGAANLLRDPTQRMPLPVLGPGNVRDPRRFLVALQSCAAVLGVVGAAVATEYLMERRAVQAGVALAALSEERSALQAEQDRSGASVRERNVIQQDLRALESRLAPLERRVAQLEPTQALGDPPSDKRRRLLPEVMAGLGRSTRGRIQVTRTSSAGDGQVEIHAVAADSSSAQRFNQEISECLTGMGWRPGRAEVRPLSALAHPARHQHRLVLLSFLPPEVP